MKNLLLFDLSGAFWTAWHATKDLEISEAFERTVAAVHKAAERADLVVVACDEPPYLRREALPTYKANREAQPPMAREQFERTKTRLRQDGFLLWGVKGHEADDVIGSAVARAVKDTRIAGTWIHSADKDLACLVDDDAGVSLYSPASDRLFAAADVLEKFGVDPCQVPDWLALVGDKSDNVEGCPGVGPVTAAKLLKQYGSLSGIYAAIDHIKPDGLVGRLRDAREQVELAQRIVTLRTDLVLPWEQLFEPRVSVPAKELPPIQEEEQVSEEEAKELISVPKNGASFEPAPLEASFEPTPKPKADALAVSPPGDWTLALEPRSLQRALELAEHLHASKMYTKLTSPQAILAIVLRGREMGLGAATALDSMHYFEGKVNMSAHLLIARAKSHPDCEYFFCEETTAAKSTWVTKNRRNPRETRISYTIEEAALAGLVKDGSGWKKHPAAMVRKMAGVSLARAEYPEALLGCYSDTEMGAE